MSTAIPETVANALEQLLQTLMPWLASLPDAQKQQLLVALAADLEGLWTRHSLPGTLQQAISAQHSAQAKDREIARRDLQASSPRSDHPANVHEAIKTCPFCGARPDVVPWHGGSPTKHLVECVNDDECDVLPAVTGETREEAITNWNRRSS